MLDNFHFLSVLKSECSSILDCSRLLTVYLFLWNLKMICKSSYEYKSVDLKILAARNWVWLWEMFVHSLWSHVQGWSKQKVKIIVFHCRLFFYRLWYVRSFIHPPLDITDFGLMQVKAGFDTPMFNYILSFFQKWNYINYLP